MRFFAFIAGFFRNQAAESSTRLVGIIACIVGLGLATILILHSCSPTPHEITWTDIAVVFGVLAFCCTALGLRSPFPTELMAPAGAKVTTTAETTKVEQTATTTTAESK